jgi:DNA-directed RNA polymerase subunit H (RpoH/RPB5)
MSTPSSRIISIYKSRRTILELLDNEQYQVDDYLGFSVNEIDAMYTNSQLDMLLTNTTDERKLYIKYYVSPKQTAKQIRPANLDEIVEDLFVIDNVLTKNDTLVIIIDDEPNETIINKIKYLYERDGIFVVIHNIQRLQFNILNHALVPKIQVLTDKETQELYAKYNLTSAAQLPEISRFDPQALAICLRPGKVCKITRDSATAMTHDHYRMCVN